MPPAPNQRTMTKLSKRSPDFSGVGGWGCPAGAVRWVEGMTAGSAVPGEGDHPTALLARVQVLLDPLGLRGGKRAFEEGSDIIDVGTAHGGDSLRVLGTGKADGISPPADAVCAGMTGVPQKVAVGAARIFFHWAVRHRSGSDLLSG